MNPTTIFVLLVSLFALFLVPLGPHAASASTCMTAYATWSPAPQATATISAEACAVTESGGFITQEFHIVNGSTNNATIVPLNGTHEFAGRIGAYVYDKDFSTSGVFSMDSHTFNHKVTCVITVNTLTLEYLPTGQTNTLFAEGLQGIGSKSNCV